MIYNDTITASTSQYINSQPFNGISTTRNYEFARQWGRKFVDFMTLKTFAILVLDRNIIKQNHKIFPLDFFSTVPGKRYRTDDWQRRQKQWNESEEFVVGDIELTKCLIRIDLPNSAWLDFKKSTTNHPAIEMLINHPKLFIIDDLYKKPSAIKASKTGKFINADRFP
jgi:hypothetical protein